MSSPRKPRWYFSLRSPYSWFAYRDLVAGYPDVADRVEWIPFWEPDERSTAALRDRGVELQIVDMSRAKNFYILQDTRRLAQARGVTMAWPIDRDPCWEVAHLGYLVADEAGLGRPYVDRVYRARWEEGRDISDPATIADIATGLGLDAGAVAGAAEDPEWRERGVDALVRSHKDGLFGVPFFVNGRDKYFGVERLRIYAAAVRGEEYVPDEDLSWLGLDVELPELARPGGDGSHGGGCA